MYRRSIAGAALLAALLAFASPPSARAADAPDPDPLDARTRRALELAPRPKDGAVLFERHCRACHGPGARGDPSRDVPMLAGQRFPYLVKQLASFGAGERDSVPMHRVASRAAIREPQAWADLASYVSRLPPPPSVQTGDGRDVALGRGIFHEQCATCHGPDAGGGDRGFVPRLRHQHYGYLVAQLHGLAAGRRHDADEQLVRFLQSFDDRDVAAVADYLSRLPPAWADRRGPPADDSAAQ